MKTFIFKISLQENPKIYRDIEVLENTNLYKLAEVINDAYDFAFDHPFGFFDNLTDPYQSKKSYDLFADIKDEGIEPTGAKSVGKTKVKEVWKSVGDKMLFLFDYGDEWLFVVELKSFGDKDSAKKYPVTLNKIGKSPKQY